MDIYLINLERRPDRLSHVTHQLDRLQLPFELFRAIDAQNENVELPAVQHDRFVVNHKKSPVRGEIGCAASHIGVWQRFLETDEEYALVLEDDINIGDELPLIQDQMQSLGLDFLNLSSNAPYTVDGSTLSELCTSTASERPKFFQRSARRKWSILEWRRRWRIFRLHPLANGHIVCECDPAPALGSGYIISRKAAQAFMTTAEQLYFPIDLIWRFSPGKLRLAFLARPLVTQTQQDSDISGRFDQGRIALKYRLMRPILKSRRLRRRIDVLRLYGFLRH